MALQSDDVRRILRHPALASSTHKQYLAFFDHWQLSSRNSYGPESDPHIPEGLHRETESRVCEFVVWQLKRGVRGPSIMTQLAAINYFHSIRGLGLPLSTMRRLKQLLRVVGCLDEGGAMCACPE